MSLKNNLQNKLYKLIASQKQVKKNYISILMVAFPECLLYKWRGDKKGECPNFAAEAFSNVNKICR